MYRGSGRGSRGLSVRKNNLRRGASGQPHSVISARKFAAALTRLAWSATVIGAPVTLFARVVRLVRNGSMCRHRSKSANDLSAGSVTLRNRPKPASLVAREDTVLGLQVAPLRCRY